MKSTSFSSTDFLVPHLLHCRAAEVWGLVFVAFCIGTGAQQFLVAMFWEQKRTEPLLADLAAMHGLAEMRTRTYSPKESDDVKIVRLLVVSLGKVALENVPQLVLQSSFFSLVFDELTSVGRAKVLLSIGLGLLSASQKILDATRMNMWLLYERVVDFNGRCLQSVCLVPLMLAMLVIPWTLAKLYFVFHCETHLWNLGSGCVEAR